MKANHKENTFLLGRQKLTLNKGQFVMGLINAKEELALAKSTISYWLDFLEKEGQVELKKTNKYTIITIQKWKDYQVVGLKSDSNEDTDGTQIGTNKNDKECIRMKKKMPNGIVSGNNYKPDYNPPKRKPKVLTDKQKIAVKRLRALSYFHDKGIENGFDYLLEEDDQANRKFVGLARAFEKRYPENWKEVIDWWFETDNAWCDYHPSNFFSVSNWMKFDNKHRQPTNPTAWAGDMPLYGDKDIDSKLKEGVIKFNNRKQAYEKVI